MYYSPMVEYAPNHEALERCPFCDILKGTAEGLILKRNKNTSLILSLEGHPLVVTNAHMAMSEVDSETAAELGQQVIGSLDTIKSYFQADGVNIYSSLGQAAGQEIEHTHIHMIPRFNGDGVGKFPKGLPRKRFSERHEIASGLREVLVER